MCGLLPSATAMSQQFIGFSTASSLPIAAMRHFLADRTSGFFQRQRPNNRRTQAIIVAGRGAMECDPLVQVPSATLTPTTLSDHRAAVTPYPYQTGVMKPV
jgi:hypothetical protein